MASVIGARATEGDYQRLSEHTTAPFPQESVERRSSQVSWLMSCELERARTTSARDNEHTSGESEPMRRTSGASIIFPARSQARAPAKPDAKGRNGRARLKPRATHNAPGARTIILIHLSSHRLRSCITHQSFVKVCLHDLSV